MERERIFNQEWSLQDFTTPTDFDPNPEIEHRNAFSRGTRQEIIRRATDRFGYPASEISGRNDMPLQAAHINHNRRNPHYDDPDNGILMTVDEHLQDHIEREGCNGLTKAGNRLAIDLLSRQLEDLNKVHDIDPDFSERLKERLMTPRPKRIPV